MRVSSGSLGLYLVREGYILVKKGGYMFSIQHVDHLLSKGLNGQLMAIGLNGQVKGYVIGYPGFVTIDSASEVVFNEICS